MQVKSFMFDMIRSELEDVTYLDTTGNGDSVLTAYGANATRLYFSKVVILCSGYIPLHVKTCVMIILLVCTASKRTTQQRYAVACTFLMVIS